ncbi:M28 family metallopeptidase [Kordiimonas aestuarii]|uniref:M28 family metallopeptidase n=1 Tax=Kordiimonas aestuarii TaxID=1005925 RepID=UPI0021D081A4|nr:M28 family metallopeptidase [Kordiimonas aestuarii]
MKNILTISAVALALAACGNTQKDEKKQNTAPYEMSAEALGEHIRELASDEYGGRAPASPGEELTVRYIEKQFKDAGLKGANGGSFIQDVPLVSVETRDAPAMTLSKDGENLELAYRGDQVIWTRHEQTATRVADSDMVFVGYGINAPERGWNDYEGIDVTGKTVVIMVNDPGFATQNTDLFEGNTMTYYGRWDYKFAEAARQGAAAAVIIHETKPAAYGWATVDSSWTGPQFDMVRDDKGASLADAEGWITTEAADKLFTMAGLNRADLQEAAAKPGFKAVPMEVTFAADFTSEVNHINSRNVAGYIKGSEHPDEVFIYMAHWDHIGTDPNAEGDGIYNGALDNASGTGGLIELARAYAGAGKPPKRSVLFLAVTAEEQGLLGSAYYAANPLFPLEKTIGGINMDGLNYYGPTKDVTVIGLGNSELDSYLDQAAKMQDRILVADQEPEKGYFYRSDHFELSKRGVPMLYPNSGYDHREKGRAYVDALVADYLEKRYHQPADEYDASWELSGAVEDLELYYNTGRLLIDSEVWPNWSEGSEFKALRDEQRAGQ